MLTVTGQPGQHVRQQPNGGLAAWRRTSGGEFVTGAAAVRLQGGNILPKQDGQPVVTKCGGKVDLN